MTEATKEQLEWLSDLCDLTAFLGAHPSLIRAHVGMDVWVSSVGRNDLVTEVIPSLGRIELLSSGSSPYISCKVGRHALNIALGPEHTIETLVTKTVRVASPDVVAAIAANAVTR